MNWNSFDRGVFLVNCLAIVYNPKTKMILIGKRESDTYVKELEWSFPGGRPTYDQSLEDSLKKEVKKKTGLDVEIKQLIFARIPSELNEQVLLYYYTEQTGGKEKAGEKFVEIKWIRPTEIAKYSNTTVDSTVVKFLKQLK